MEHLLVGGSGFALLTGSGHDNQGDRGQDMAVEEGPGSCWAGGLLWDAAEYELYDGNHSTLLSYPP